MKPLLRQKIWLSIVIITNLALWIIPSNVVEQVARDRHVLLGRYSRTHFMWIVFVVIVSVIGCYIDWSTGKTYRRRWFQVLTTLALLLPVLAVVDFALRPAPHYIRSGDLYHRPPSAEFQLTFEDRPQAHRTYPDAPPGHPTVECTLRTDARGYRNPSAEDQYDVVALGDSFAEGSGVSDEHPWPRQLAELSGRSVYNLGMSGYDPAHYLEALRVVGLPLKPKVVICMIYEGNDFRSARSDRKRLTPGLGERLSTWFKQSPVIGAMDGFLINTFGPINSTGPFRGMETLDWMPLTIPDGPDARRYAFAPKQLRDLYLSRDEFALGKHWLNSRSLLTEMNEMCRKAGATLVIVLAPTTAHITLPLVADSLPPDKVRAFTALDYDNDLPEAETFLRELLDRASARESVVSEWCRQESIPFVSLTGDLRKAARGGRQVYYTYDQHWTPAGHEVVARSILDSAHDILAPRTSGAVAAGRE